jgi:4-amino-4-deoxy-L-arabinose transferase-like glycosyltransferase
MKKAVPIIILALISAVLIFYRFTEIPKYLAFDEVEFAKLALSLNNKPYIPYSQLATGHSTLYFYIILTSLKTFGISAFALRFPAAIFGILSILMFYLIIKGLKNYEIRIKNYNVLPFLLAIILLMSRWFFNFARFSFEATFLLFLELASIYFLTLANAKVKNFLRLGIPRFLRGGFPLEQKNLLLSISSNSYLIISGLFAGLAFNSYTPGRIFFLLPLFFLILRTLKTFKLYKLSLLYFLIPFIIIITPLTSYLITDKDNRIDKLFFWKNHEMTVNQKISGTIQNISTISQMFIIKGDVNGMNNYPGKAALNPILGILFLAGLIIALKKYKDINNQLFLFYFALSIFPSLAIYPWENPSMLRTYTVIPAVIYFIGQGIIFILDRFQNNRKKFVMIFIIALIFISSFYELHTYFIYQSQVFKESFIKFNPLEKELKVDRQL